MKAQLIIALSLLAVVCKSQQLQIIRPDGSVFASIFQHDYVALRTTSRSYVAGQLTVVKPDTITVSYKNQVREVPVSQIDELKKTSKFGITAKRLSTYASIVPIILLPDANSSVYEGRTWGNRLLTRAAIIIPVGVGIGLIMNGSPLKKARKGYSFRVVP